MDPVSSQQQGQISDRPRRRSAFLEIGPDDDDSSQSSSGMDTRRNGRPVRRVRFRSKDEIFGLDSTKRSDSERDDVEGDEDTTEFGAHGQKLDAATWKQIRENATRAWTARTERLYRMGVLVFLIAAMMPILQSTSLFGKSGHTLAGVNAGVIRTPKEGLGPVFDSSRTAFAKRADSPTDICFRWSQQSAIVNGTLYLYGGRATTSSSQNSSEWNNNFLTMDLTIDWQISSPSLTGLPQPSGPPAVANGYLWNSHSALYLYGGEFSEDPPEEPTAFSGWEYDITSSSWIEHSDPTTSAGVNSAPDGMAVQRAAEGAGFGVANLGRGWYFGGHQDLYTTQGWSNQIARIYLKSMIEYTFPGATNDEVTSLKDGATAGSDGVWRNITNGGLQEDAGFTERADGVLLYIPGFGDEGILIGLAGGTAKTFTQMNVIDIYDIATSTWYKQSTSGSIPDMRVNPCAVVAAAADGSSYNVYMFGGQNLQPYGSQVQKNDMWILTVPSFTWIEVDMSDQSVPYGRSGHTCNIWDGQMIVVGGYVPNLTCESPAIYVFNTSSLEWANQYTALSGAVSGSGQGASDSISGNFEGNDNPFSQQLTQRGSNSSSGLEGSYGYAVPEIVYSVIGGGPTGGATVTTPAATATAGPMATGSPITYTVTGPNGAVVTTTSPPNSSGGGGPNIAAIVVGVVAGILLIVALYFAFCAWIYRKQLKLYKNHVAMSQRAAADPRAAEKEGFILPPSAKNSSDRREGSLLVSSTHGSGNGSGSNAIASSGTDVATGSGSGGGRYDEIGRSSSVGSSAEDLLAGQEPSFWGVKGVLLNPRRSLRVINRD